MLKGGERIGVDGRGMVVDRPWPDPEDALLVAGDVRVGLSGATVSTLCSLELRRGRNSGERT